MRRLALIALSGTLLVGGCAGAVHRLPQVSQGEVAKALAEVQSGGSGLHYRQVSRDEVLSTVRSAILRIRDPAAQVCREMNVGECDWKFRVLGDHSLNAAAMMNGMILINRGLVEYAANEEEVCMAIAHEIAHQAADHVAQGLRNQMVGAAIGAVLLGVATAAATSRERNSGAVIGRAVNLGARAGAMIGHLSYSKEQEREADYLAALILYRAGVDLEKSRGLLVGMARLSSRTESTMFDSHPVGPERLAAWDRAVAEVRASGGSLPPRAN